MLHSAAPQLGRALHGAQSRGADRAMPDGIDDMDDIDFKALVRARLAPLPIDAARAADIVDELAQHVAEHHAELIASGVPGGRRALETALAPLDDRDTRRRARSRAPIGRAPRAPSCRRPPPRGLRSASDDAPRPALRARGC